MNWLGWLLALFIAYWFLSDLFPSKRCDSHGVFGRCRRCEEEAAARVKAEAEARTKARAEAERQRMEIEETYRGMDEAKRDELTALVKERAKREDLIIGPGHLQAAVVRMYERSQRHNNQKEASPDRELHLRTPGSRLVVNESPRDNTSVMKNPMDRPTFHKEKAGPCPKCGWPETVARKSRTTGELYFGCSRPKLGPTGGCNFKGCRSH